MKVAAKIRSVVVGPLDLDDMQDEKVKAIISEVEEFYMRFTRGDDNKCTGCVLTSCSARHISNKAKPYSD